MMNLAIWFAVHVAFAEVETINRYGMQLLIPDWATIDLASVALAAGAFIAMLRFKGMMPVILVCALLEWPGMCFSQVQCKNFFVPLNFHLFSMRKRK